MKRVLTKNITCIFFALALIAVFFAIYNKELFTISIFSKMLPFYMMALVLGVFSLSWSIREANISTFKNSLAIYLTLLFTIFYIVVESVNVTIWSKSNIYDISKIISYVFFGLSIVCLLFDFSYAIYIDVNYLKNSENN
jgi:hypothetical protein